MTNLMRAEVKKIVKSKAIWIMMLMMLFLSLTTSLSTLNYIGAEGAEKATAMQIPLTGYDAFASTLKDMPLILFLGIFVIGVILCHDFESRFIHMEVSCGYSRAKIIISKILSVMIAYAVVLLPYPLGRAVFQSMITEFGTPFNLSIALKMIAMFVTIFMAGLALNGITMLLAILIKKTVFVIGSAFVVVVLGTSFLSSLAYANEGFGEILSHTPMGFFKLLAVNNYSSGVLLKAFLISALFVFVFSYVSHLFFRRMELN